MKKIFLTLAGLLTLGSADAWAIAGGPFDNGDPAGILVERRGFYQCAFSFANGNGYGIFTPDAQLAGNLPNAQAAQGNSTQQVGIFNRTTLYTPGLGGALTHNANRSVFYYKGLTYVGSCFGMVDTFARSIQGACNATTNDQLTQQTLSSNNGGLVNAAQAATTQQNIVINNSAFILNMGWEGKIRSTRPVLTFRGKGQMSIISPTGQSTISSLAFTGFSGLIDAIVTSVSNSGGALATPDYAGAQAAIEAALKALQDGFLSNNGVNDAFKDAQKVNVRVYGSRRFF